jgi:hypothetical protein
LHTECGNAIAHAIEDVRDHGARAALSNGLDDADAAELAVLLAEALTGVSAADAVGDALAIGIVAGRAIERAAQLCSESQALIAQAQQIQRRYPLERFRSRSSA